MSSGRWLAAKLLDSLALWALILTLTFLALRLAPGGPFDGERAFSPEVLANLNRHYGLDLPLHEQFGRWITGILRGDFGESLSYTGVEVSSLIIQGLTVSLTVGAAAILLGSLMGVTIALLSLSGRVGFLLYSVLITVGLSLPSFLSGSVLILIFSIWLKWLPPALLESPSAAILPILTLSLRPLAQTARVLRTQLLSTHLADFVRTAHAKGASPFRVFFFHELRLALLSLLSIFPPLAAGVLTGSFVIEAMFQIPGLGKHFVGGVLNRDFPLVMGVTFVYGTILISLSLACEVASRWADPRLRSNDS